MLKSWNPKLQKVLAMHYPSIVVTYINIFKCLQIQKHSVSSCDIAYDGYERIWTDMFVRWVAHSSRCNSCGWAAAGRASRTLRSEARWRARNEGLDSKSPWDFFQVNVHSTSPVGIGNQRIWSICKASLIATALHILQVPGTAKPPKPEDWLRKPVLRCDCTKT